MHLVGAFMQKAGALAPDTFLSCLLGTLFEVLESGVSAKELEITFGFVTREHFSARAKGLADEANTNIWWH